MSECKHTPGPWEAVCQDVHDGARPVGDDGVRYWTVEMPWDAGDKYRGSVCNVFSAAHIGGITLPERDANARLIAAAPDMLEALTRVVFAYGANSAEPEAAFRAITAHIDAARAAIARAEGRDHA